MRIKFVAVLMIISELISGSICDNWGNRNMILRSKEGMSAQDIYIDEENVDRFLQEYREQNDTLNAFLDTNGVIIVSGDIDVNDKVENCLGIKVRDVETQAKAGVETITKTLYYKEGDVLATYEIRIENAENMDEDAVVEKALVEIRNTQETIQQNDAIMVIENIENAVKIAKKTYSYICEPKGELKAIYNIYAIVDSLDEDYYFVKADVTGFPGADLGTGDSSYETGYWGEEINVSITTPTSGMSFVDAKPDDVDNKTEVTVNVGGVIGTEFAIEGGVSWTFGTEDVTIDRTISKPKASWEVVMSGNAIKNTYKFSPIVIYSCPTGKTSVVFDTYASYTLDSLFTFNETIELNKSFTCTP